MSGFVRRKFVSGRWVNATVPWKEHLIQQDKIEESPEWNCEKDTDAGGFGSRMLSILSMEKDWARKSMKSNARANVLALDRAN